MEGNIHVTLHAALYCVFGEHMLPVIAVQEPLWPE